MNDLNTWTTERLESFTYNESTNEHLHRYALVFELVAGKRVLDIAAGEGYGSAILANVAEHVTAIDRNAITVALANREYKSHNLKFLTGSVTHIPCKPDEFDVVVSFGNIEHNGQHTKMMQEIKRVLKPGGLLVISSPDKLYYGKKAKAQLPYPGELYRDEFESLLKKSFKNTSFLQQRPFCGSVIMPQIQSPGNKDAKMYIGNNNYIVNDEEAQYLIGLASDAELPSLKPSLYGGETVLKHQFEALRKMVTQMVTADVTREIKNSRTYKIGDAILKRWRRIKKIFGAGE